MSTAATIAVSFAVAGAASLAATPVAIRVAWRTDFLDRPRGYRKHAAATPFLGGAAVLSAFLIAGLLVAGATRDLLVVVGCAVGLSVLGTIDDRIAVAPKWRLLAEAGAAAALVAAGVGWKTSLGIGADLTLTIVWVVGVVNAFNLMDNLDGACSTVATVSAAGIGALAVIKGNVTIAALAFALSGACAGFLPWNLAGPARIFLGDGGSMPVGFLVAALAMATTRSDPGGSAEILAGALLVGLPILDTALVSVSRIRRGVRLVTGGRDHLTHRLLLALRSPRAVAAALALGQALACSLAILSHELGTAGMAALALGALWVGVVAIMVLDTERWRPAGIAVGGQPPPQVASTARAESVASIEGPNLPSGRSI